MDVNINPDELVDSELLDDLIEDDEQRLNLIEQQKPKPTKSKYLEMKRLQFQGWIDDS